MCGVATRERCGAAVIACTRLFIEFFPERTLVTVMGSAHSATGAGPQRVSGAAYTVTSQPADAGRTRDTATFSRAAVNSARPAVSMLVTVASSGYMAVSAGSPGTARPAPGLNSHRPAGQARPRTAAVSRS